MRCLVLLWYTFYMLFCMSARTKAPDPQEEGFVVYLEHLASAVGRADRHDPLKSYCKGLLLSAGSLSPAATAPPNSHCVPGLPRSFYKSGGDRLSGPRCRIAR